MPLGGFLRPAALANGLATGDEPDQRAALKRDSKGALKPGVAYDREGVPDVADWRRVDWTC